MILLLTLTVSLWVVEELEDIGKEDCARMLEGFWETSSQQALLDILQLSFKVINEVL